MSTSNTTKKSHPSRRRYPLEIRERAGRMVREALRESSRSHSLVTRVAGQLGLGSETLCKWVRQAD
jgi:transposase